MALTSCAECGKELSSEALSCPHCGAPTKTGKAKQKKKIPVLAVVTLAIAIVTLVAPPIFLDILVPLALILSLAVLWQRQWIAGVASICFAGVGGWMLYDYHQQVDRARDALQASLAQMKQGQATFEKGMADLQKLGDKKTAVIEPAEPVAEQPAAPLAPAPTAAEALPQDVQVFTQRRDTCDHLRGEGPNEGVSKATFERSLDESCKGTDGQLAGLRGKYASAPGVIKKLSEYEDLIEN